MNCIWPHLYSHTENWIPLPTAREFFETFEALPIFPRTNQDKAEKSWINYINISAPLDPTTAITEEPFSDAESRFVRCSTHPCSLDPANPQGSHKTDKGERENPTHTHELHMSKDLMNLNESDLDRTAQLLLICTSPLWSCLPFCASQKSCASVTNVSAVRPFMRGLNCFRWGKRQRWWRRTWRSSIWE